MAGSLGLVAEKLQGIKRQYGADAIGGIGSAKLSNESNYLLQRFMRQLVGTNNIDHRDGGDVSAIDTGLPAMAEIMKPQYGPDPIHDVVLLFGIDSNEELPVLDLHLKRAIRRHLKVIVAHPRHTELPATMRRICGTRRAARCCCSTPCWQLLLRPGRQEV